MGGHQPYVPIGMFDEETKRNNSGAPGNNSQNNLYSQYGTGTNNEMKQRARVLCSYDAKDSTELNLSANEVSTTWSYYYSSVTGVGVKWAQNICFVFVLVFSQIILVTECNPPNSDYMYGKQGLVNGLVPRAFLELLDE